MVGLTDADIVGYLARKGEVGTELTALDFGIDLADDHIVFALLTLDGGRQTHYDAVDVVLVNLCRDLERRHIVNLTDRRARADVASQHHIQCTHLAVNGGFHTEVIHSLAYELHIAGHRLQVAIHLLHLICAVERVLLLTLHNQCATLHRVLIVLLRLQPHLTRQQILFVEHIVILKCATLALHLHIELHLLLTQRKTILLHLDKGVAQDVLLLGKIGFGVENLHREVIVGEFDNHIALFDHRTLLGNDALHQSCLHWRNLHRGDWLHRTRQTHIVVELGLLDGRDCEDVGINAQRG